jgi:hypothetical protein
MLLANWATRRRTTAEAAAASCAGRSGGWPLAAAQPWTAVVRTAAGRMAGQPAQIYGGAAGQDG